MEKGTKRERKTKNCHTKLTHKLHTSQKAILSSSLLTMLKSYVLNMVNTTQKGLPFS